MRMSITTPAALLAAVALSSASPAQSMLVDGCMENRIEDDILNNDIWHGPTNEEPPAIDERCDGPNDTCEFGPAQDISMVSDFHSDWETGSLSSHGHSNMPGECNS